MLELILTITMVKGPADLGRGYEAASPVYGGQWAQRACEAKAKQVTREIAFKGHLAIVSCKPFIPDLPEVE